MHKLSLYLNDDQYEKLELLCKESPFQNTEEYANEMFYDWLLYKWLRHKGEQYDAVTGDRSFITGDDEDLSAPYIHDGIYCDGEQAIIGDIALQRIDGVLHYLVVSPGGVSRVRCNDIAAEQYEKILKDHDAILENMSREELEQSYPHYIKED